MTNAGDDLFGSATGITEDPGDTPTTSRTTGTATVPLAERMRPRTLDEVVGQAALLGPEGVLRRLARSSTPSGASRGAPSILLWGPPGTGKTTLARLLAGERGESFVALSAVTATVRDVRGVIEASARARAAGRSRSLLFLDEIHRFNKAQQDALLPALEDGTLGLMGATTENPSFALNRALLSRVRVFRLQPLERGDLMVLLKRALQDPERGIAIPVPEFSTAALERLAEHSDGDARRALTALETIVGAAPRGQPIDAAALVAFLGDRTLAFDRHADEWHRLISALHKTVRGSDPDAALYWLTRMLAAGCPPEYLGRRLLRMAYEDVGLAAPQLAAEALTAWQTVERLGSPEGDLALAQITVRLALAPKSNEAYVAFKAARAAQAQIGSAPVPMHLLNAPTQMMRDEGFGSGYAYDHDTSDGVAWGQSLWPEGVAPQSWLVPHSRHLDSGWARRLQWLRAGRAAAARGGGNPDGDEATFSGSDSGGDKVGN